MSPGKGRLVSFISSSHTQVWQTGSGRDNLDAASRARVVGKEGATGWDCLTNSTSACLEFGMIKSMTERRNMSRSFVLHTVGSLELILNLCS